MCVVDTDGWKRYIEDVKSGKEIVGNLMRLAVYRFEGLIARDDVVLDEDKIRKCILFIAQMKHFRGKTAGQNFFLQPWQQFIVANLIGLRKSDGRRLCAETYIQVARKCGKDAFVAAIVLYLMVCENDHSFQGACLANSREQSRILFEYITKFAKSMDPNGKFIKYFRNYISMPSTDSTINVYSSDASKLDGLNASVYVCDEWHEAKDRSTYDVMKSSTAFRENPLGIIITTAGFHLEGPCYAMYQYSVEVLNGVKRDDTFFPFIFMIDDGDDWKDPKNFKKCQPNLGITVDEEFMVNEALKATNDASAENGIKVKTFNMWTQSSKVWLRQNDVVRLMDNFDVADFEGLPAYVGIDLSSVQDTSSLSVMIPKDGKFYFKSFAFLPHDTIEKHPNRELYKRFIRDGDLIETEGNIIDYDYIFFKLCELREHLQILGVYFDPYNSSQFNIMCTEAGFNMVPYSQGLLHFSPCVREFEKIVLEGTAVFQKSAMLLWEIGNCSLKEDHNGNRKPVKQSAYAKIDSVITCLMCIGGYLGNPVNTGDLDIFVIS